MSVDMCCEQFHICQGKLWRCDRTINHFTLVGCVICIMFATGRREYDDCGGVRFFATTCTTCTLRIICRAWWKSDHGYTFKVSNIDSHFPRDAQRDVIYSE